MNKKYTLDMLNKDGVSLKTQNSTVVDGVEYPIGQPHRKAYLNSIEGRQAVLDELPESQKNAVFAVWGEEPTVNEMPDAQGEPE